ncbi:MAG: GIY-YIG nuclease family protein [Erysipelotrichaceae bacterium]
MKHYTLSLKIPVEIQNKLKKKINSYDNEKTINSEMNLLIYDGLVNEIDIKEIMKYQFSTLYVDFSHMTTKIKDHYLWGEVKENQALIHLTKEIKNLFHQQNVKYKDKDFVHCIKLVKVDDENISLSIPAYHFVVNEIILGTKSVPIIETYQLKSNIQYVYIIECVDGTFYTGWTSDINKRYQMHINGKGAKYTKAHKPKRLVYVETFKDKGSALKREYEIKQLSKAAKKELIKKAYHCDMPEI